jgi:hypothetical protein
MKITEEQMKELLTPKNGSFIKARIENGKCGLEIKARGIDQLAMLMSLTEHILKNSPMTIDEYCELLKHALRDDKSLDTFDKLFREVMENKK